MYNAPYGVSTKNKSSKFLQKMQLAKNGMKKQNSKDKIQNRTNFQDLNSYKITNKSYNPDLYNQKLQDYSKNHKNNKKDNIPKTPLITSKTSLRLINKNPKSSIQYYDNETEINKCLNRNSSNFFVKNEKNKKSAKNCIPPTFDYNLRNNHKAKTNILLNLKNSNSKPIKLQNEEEHKTLYKNKNYNISNSSMDWKNTSLYETNSNRYKTLKNSSSITTKNSKRNSENKKGNLFYNTNGNKKFLSTPDCTRKAAFIKHKGSSSNKGFYDEKKAKEIIKMMFEKEFNERIVQGYKTKKNNHNNNNSININNNNNNNNSLIMSYSRNRIDDIKGPNYIHSQSQKNILNLYNNSNSNEFYNKLRSESHEYNTISVEKNYKNKNKNKTKSNYKKYYSILEQRIKKLNEEIQEMKEEERHLVLQLIDYKQKENECLYIRKLREEVKKYKGIIEKCNKACEEYSLEISKIKNTIGEI